MSMERVDMYRARTGLDVLVEGVISDELNELHVDNRILQFPNATLECSTQTRRIFLRQNDIELAHLVSYMLVNAHSSELPYERTSVREL